MITRFFVFAYTFPKQSIFNEWFAKDTSRKVKSALHAKFEKGERIFAYAPLGYKRHPEIKNTLTPDEETRWIVEKIFDFGRFMALRAAKITRILIAEKVPTAGWLNYQAVRNLCQHLRRRAGGKVLTPGRLHRSKVS